MPLLLIGTVELPRAAYSDVMTSRPPHCRSRETLVKRAAWEISGRSRGDEYIHACLKQ